MSADVLERPASTPAKKPPHRPAPTSATPKLFNADRLQAIVDAVIAPLDEDGVRHPIPLPSVLPGVTPMSDETDDEGRPLQMPCCVLDEKGEVEFGSGPVVTDGLCQWLEERLRPRIEQMVHRQLAVMSRSLDSHGRGVVEKPFKVIKPIDSVDDF